jgi:hypothetical protein
VASTSSEEVAEFLATSLRGVPGYSIVASRDTVLLKRRYIPNWALLVAGVCVFVFLLGLLALFVKEKESATILLGPSGGGTRLTITGVVSEKMRQRLTSSLATISQRWPAIPAGASSSTQTDTVTGADAIPTEEQSRQLLRLAELRDKGAISHEEFEGGKSQILGGGAKSATLGDETRFITE